MNRIKFYRDKRGMTQQQLSKESNVSRPFLSQIENDVKQPSINALRRIASALQVSVADLLQDEA